MFLLLMMACPVGEAYVLQTLEGARPCEEVEDCVFIGPSCDFGCYIPVNQSRAEEMTELIADYEDAEGGICNAFCGPKPELACLSGLCTGLVNVD